MILTNAQYFKTKMHRDNPHIDEACCLIPKNAAEKKYIFTNKNITMNCNSDVSKDFKTQSKKKKRSNNSVKTL